MTTKTQEKYENILQEFDKDDDMTELKVLRHSVVTVKEVLKALKEQEEELTRSFGSLWADEVLRKQREIMDLDKKLSEQKAKFEEEVSLKIFDLKNYINHLKFNYAGSHLTQFNLFVGRVFNSLKALTPKNGVSSDEQNSTQSPQNKIENSDITCLNLSKQNKTGFEDKTPNPFSHGSENVKAEKGKGVCSICNHEEKGHFQGRLDVLELYSKPTIERPTKDEAIEEISKIKQALGEGK